MINKSLLVLLIFSFNPTGASLQEQKPVQRQDSVTVSAGISKEQLALEDHLKGLILHGDELLLGGNTVDAIKQYENALYFVHKQPLLEEQESHVMEKLARGYVVGNRPADAIPIYSHLLAEKKSCQSESMADTDCASLQHRLGVAQINALDFQVALSSFQNAEANYARAAKLANIHEIMMIDLMNQAQSKTYIAVALFRVGKTAEAVAIIKSAIPLLDRIQSDENLQIGIRDEAKHSLEEANTIQAHLQSVQ
jgi:tetratricopeptide (TPR) repeat protein